jgi:hypothetical protein
MLEACGYPNLTVKDALGLIAFVVFIAAVIGVAAGLTWIVVRFSPAPKKGPEPEQQTSA